MPLKNDFRAFYNKRALFFLANFERYNRLYLLLYIQSMYRRYVHHFLTKVVNIVCLSARIPPEKVGRCRSRPTSFSSLTFGYRVRSYRRFTKKRWVGSAQFRFNSPCALRDLGSLAKLGSDFFGGGLDSCTALRRTFLRKDKERRVFKISNSLTFILLIK